MIVVAVGGSLIFVETFWKKKKTMNKKIIIKKWEKVKDLKKLKKKKKKKMKKEIFHIFFWYA